MLKEEKVVDWKSLTMPSKLATDFMVIFDRLQQIEDKYTPDKTGKNYVQHTRKLLTELVNNIEGIFKPKTPRTLEDAHNYALTRKYKGTFLACMNEEDQLVKVMILAKGEILDKIPAIKFEDKEIEVKMTQHLLMIPDMDIARSVPKSIVKVIPFSSDKKNIRTYKQ